MAVTRYKTSYRRFTLFYFIMNKFFNKYLFLLCIAFGVLIFSSCSKDDDAENGSEVINPDKNVPDPTGTVTLNIMIGDDGIKSFFINDFGTILIDRDHNFYGGDGYDYSFVSLGKMKGLGNITAIPQGEWNSCVAVVPGEGYVVRRNDPHYNDSYNCYARLYVVREIGQTSGGVGYTIKYQAPFVLEHKFAAGNGTETDPYIITTAAQLDEVRNFPNACFELGNDIDLSSYLYSSIYGWKPIDFFHGKFDGKKHTIKGLWIDFSYRYESVGLFAHVQGSDYYKRASISNLFVNISDKGIKGLQYIGGICGFLSYGNIENCMVTGNIYGDHYVGGLVGYCNYHSSISQCVSSGNITAPYGYVGGILGLGYCDIENSYSIANVKVKHLDMYPKYGIGGYAKNCYFAGTVSVTNDCHWCPFGEDLSNCYYDSEKTGITGPPEGIVTTSPVAKALTTKEMKQQASFQGWDFDKIWTIEEGVDYPKLRSLQK